MKKNDRKSTLMQQPGLDDLATQARQGTVDRREFIRRAVALGVAAPFATSLLSQSAYAAMPKKGGRFVLGLGYGSTTDSLIPGANENGFISTLSYAFQNQLTEIDNQGRTIPELAESFEANADATVWTFKLRRGVEFHNGKTMTADDVIPSFNHHRGEDTKSAGKAFLESVVSITKKGKYEVEFKLTEGNADFPSIVSSGQFPIVPATDGILDWQSNIGTGGYTLENYQPGVRAQLKRSPNYFKSDRAHFDEIEMISLLDTTARQNAVMNGAVHAISRVDPKTVHLMNRVSKLKVVEATGTLHYTFPMRVDTAPFDNEDLRMAVKLSVDREQLVQKVLLNHGALGNDHPISTANPYHNATLPQRGYDPDKARFHLKKAGMEGVTLDLSTSDAAFAGAVDAALLIKDSAAKSGLNINVVREPKDGYWSNVWNKKPWSACYWSGRPTEDWMFSAAYTAGGTWNDTAWHTGPAADRFNKLVKLARAELDTSKRRVLYYECQEIVSNKGGALVPMFANFIMAVDKSIGHDKLAGNFDLDGYKAAERWWFS
ncbi:MAG: peptide/nickel transport system substrate-binding protein [Planctomycetota bacterium]|jgi:peptide/nickel transport system substrate-binding protein